MLRTMDYAYDLVARIKFLRDQIRGKIAWVGPHGIGVEFQTTECV